VPKILINEKNVGKRCLNLLKNETRGVSQSKDNYIALSYLLLNMEIIFDLIFTIIGEVLIDGFIALFRKKKK